MVGVRVRRRGRLTTRLAGLTVRRLDDLVVAGVALVLNHPLHPEVVLDELVHVDVAEALGHVYGGPLFMAGGARRTTAA